MKNPLKFLKQSMPVDKTNLYSLFVFLVLPFVFFAIGINVLEIGLAPGDGAIFGIPTKVFTAYPRLWNPYIQSGTFVFKDIGWQPFYLPGILVMRIFPNPFGYNLLLLLHYTMAGFFTFLFLSKLGLRRIASLIGGITFMFCGFFTAHKGHHSIIMTASYLPVLLYCIENLIISSNRKWLALATLAFGLTILADYTAMSMYIGMVSLPYILFRVLAGNEFGNEPIRKKILSIAAYSSVIYLGGMLLAAVEILPIIESLNYVTRQQISLDFFTSFSFPLRLLPLLLFPYIFGATSFSFYKIPYFGPWNLTELGGYMGIMPLLFMALCFFLFRSRNRQIYFWMGVFLVSLFLVLGDSNPIYQFLYRVPVYNLFRAPARNWLEGNFAAAILGGFFVHYAITDTTLQARNYYRIVGWAIAVLVGAALSILAFGKFLVETPEALQLWLQNSRLASPAVYVPLMIITLSIILICLLFQNRQHNNFWILIAATIFVDLFSFGRFHDTGYMSYKFFQKQPNSVAAFLNAAEPDRKSYRILPLNLNFMNYEDQLYPAANLLYGFSTVNAYSPIWLKSYTNLTGFAADGSGDKYQLLLNSSVLSVLSTKYVITSNPGDKAFLQNILVNNEPDSDRVIAADVNDKSWSFTGSAKRENGSVILAATSQAPVSGINYSFAPSAKTTYKIMFSARTRDQQMANHVLAIDFVGEDYDSPEQGTYIFPSEMSSDFRKFTVYLYSGEQPPATAFLRLFTYSKSPYEIKDIQFVQSGQFAYWGDEPSAGVSFSLYQEKYESPEGITVYENLNFLPRARFVKNVVTVPNTEAAVYALRYDADLDPSDTALVEGLDVTREFDAGQVIHADFSRDSAVTLSVRSGERSFLVLSDSWYPGWKAFIDGEETQIYRTNGVSRGILIEGAGAHQVQFRFAPMSFYAGLGLTTATTLMLMAWAAGLGRRKRAVSHNGVSDAGSGQP